MANKTFSERIKKLRLDNNMTMDALAEKLGVTKSRINMWENNGTVPREDILILLSKIDQCVCCTNKIFILFKKIIFGFL